MEYLIYLAVCLLIYLFIYITKFDIKPHKFSGQTQNLIIRKSGDDIEETKIQKNIDILLREINELKK